MIYIGSISSGSSSGNGSGIAKWLKDQAQLRSYLVFENDMYRDTAHPKPHYYTHTTHKALGITVENIYTWV